MITYESTLAKDSWTELLNGKTSLFLDITGSNPIGLYFSDTNSTPLLDAPISIVYPKKGGWDFQTSGLAVGQKLFARAINSDVEVTVVR
jgi:hypothetical protein